LIVRPEAVKGEVMGQKLPVLQSEFIRTVDKAEFFYAHAVEPHAVEGAQMLCEAVKQFFD